MCLFGDADELVSTEHLAHVVEESSSFFLVHYFQVVTSLVHLTLKVLGVLARVDLLD